jgi:hypothetical protein
MIAKLTDNGGSFGFRPKPQCAVEHAVHGNCPEPIAWAVNINDKEMYLCEKCHGNVLAGAFGPSIKVLAAVNIQKNS